MYLCSRRKIWTSFSCLVLLKCYHVVFSQFKIPTNLAQLAVPKMHCLYANAVVQPSVQHCPCYMAWKTKVHTWCRHCHLCINAPMLREKRWLQGIIDPPSYYWDKGFFFEKIVWFHETNGVTLHIGTNNSILTKSGVIAFWNWALHISQNTVYTYKTHEGSPNLLPWSANILPSQPGSAPWV